VLWLLAIPGLSLAGGALLAWIAYRLLAGDDNGMERDYEYDSKTHWADHKSPEAIGRRAGELTVDGRPARPKDLVVGGERIRLETDLPIATTAAAEAIPLDVLLEDPAFFVINKPAGLVVHPGAGNTAGTLMNALLSRDPALAELPRAGLVHRLDKDTSGLLVVARTAASHASLVRQIADHDVHREYQCLCVGVMTGGGTVDAPIGRHPTDRTRMTVRSDGREAVTHYRLIQRFRAHTHLRVLLETGRTHQIRVHLAHIGYPLVGDPVYGRRLLLPRGAAPEVVAALRGFRRQALHAARLEFAHPVTGKPVAAEAPLPQDLVDLIRVLATDAREAAHG